MAERPRARRPATAGPRRAAPAPQRAVSAPGRARAHTLLLEVGCEELPPAGIAPALEQLARDLQVALAEARLPAAAPAVVGTVRRLVASVEGVPSRQEDRVSLVRGPAAAVAFTPDGIPTQAAAGFARSRGVPVEAVQIREMDGGRYAVVEVREPGRPAAEVLAAVLPRVVAGLTFPKTMRWKPGGFRFARPIRWVVALLDERVVPLVLAGVPAGRRTPGHRFLSPRPVVLRDARAYPEALAAAHVVLDPAVRRARIVEQATALAAEAGGRPALDPSLLEELVWSVEHPTALLGTFDPALVGTLPREVVLVTLQHHQKAFGVEADGRLLPAFVAVRDGGTDHLDTVRTGHEWVVRARLEDARFFLEEDRRGSFARWNAELARLAHGAGLGSMADHVRRVRAVAAWLAEAASLDDGERHVLERAAALCKADLVTALVREFPELQGTVGRIYALEAGEPEPVARALEEHYWPKAAGGPLPQSLAGALLAVADRAVLLAGAVLAGLEPSGSQDPYGLRRAAAGLVAVVAGWGLAVGLRALFERAAAQFDDIRAQVSAPELEVERVRPVSAEDRARAVSACTAFALQRLRASLQEQGIAYDTLDAVFEAGDQPLDLVARAHALQAMRGDPAMPRLATAFARASRILKQGEPGPAVRADLLAEEAEVALYRALRSVLASDAWVALTAAEDAGAAAGGAGREPLDRRRDRYIAALRALASLADPIDGFFDAVLVMAPQPDVRANRLALLREVTDAFRRVADLSRLAG